MMRYHPPQPGGEWCALRLLSPAEAQCTSDLQCRGLAHSARDQSAVLPPYRVTLLIRSGAPHRRATLDRPTGT